MNMVAAAIDAGFMSLVARVGALVVEEGGLTSRAAIAALHYGIPAVVGRGRGFDKNLRGADCYGGRPHRGGLRRFCSHSLE